ncbi:MAG: hypothetical protein AAB857_02805 [Patescibacteria group bacterium]
MIELINSFFEIEELNVPVRQPFLSLFIFFTITWSNLGLTFGQTPQIQVATNTGEFIVQTVINKIEGNDILKKKTLTYKRSYVRENLNDNGQVTDRAKEEVVVIELNGNERMIEKNGKPVNKGKSSRPKIELLKVLEAVLKLNEFNVARIETLDNRPHFVINFKPKPRQKTGDSDVEEIIIRSEGVMYVDIEKFYIKQLSARMIRPYSRGGIFGWNIFSLTMANTEIVQEEFDGIVVMKSILITDRYSLFGGNTFEKHTYSYKDYQKKF